MSSHHHASQPEKHGDGHPGHAPQVAVRDGNRLLCPCCGEVLMVLPEEPLNQAISKKFDPPKIDQRSKVKRISCPTLDAIIARQEAEEEAAFHASMASKEPVKDSPASPVEPEGPRYQADPIVVPIDPDVTAHEFPEHDPPAPPKRTRTRTPKIPLVEPRPKFPRPSLEAERERDRKPRQRERRLRDPWSYRSARLYAWMYYRMQKLNVQLIGEICAKHEELELLKHELTGTKLERTKEEDSREPRPSPLGRVSVVQTRTTSDCQTTDAIETHAQSDVGMAPSDVTRQSGQPNERGPP